MQVYEELRSPKEKQQADAEGVPGLPAGSLDRYIMVFFENEPLTFPNDPDHPVYDALGEMCADNPPGRIASVGIRSISTRYLSQKCRLVDFHHLPEHWQEAFAAQLSARLGDDEESRRKYAEVLKHAPNV